MAKVHSDSERGNLLPPLQRLLFRLTVIYLLYAPYHRYTMIFVTPVVEHWLKRKMARGGEDAIISNLCMIINKIRFDRMGIICLYLFSCLYPRKVQARCPGTHLSYLGCLSKTVSQLILLVVIVRCW